MPAVTPNDRHVIDREEKGGEEKARLPLFEKAGDFAAFQRVMVEAETRCPVCMLG